MIGLGGVILEIACSPLAAKPVVNCQGFQKSGFARAVFPDEEANSRPEIQVLELVNGRDSKGVAIPIGTSVTQVGFCLAGRRGMQTLSVR
jgi:hypothetical protein